MPKIVDHEERRNSIALAAWRGIAAKGVDAITLREIAEEAGCTTGLLTHYFENKEQLLTSSLQLVVDETLDRTSGLQPTTISELLEFLDLLMPTTPERALEWRVWIWFWASSLVQPGLARRNQELQAIGTQLIEDALRSLQASDAIGSEIDVRTSAVTIYQVVNGVGLDAVLDAAAWPYERQMVHLASIVRALLGSR